MKELEKQSKNNRLGNNTEYDPVKFLQSFENGVLGNISSYGLPVENILVPLEERITVFRNVEITLSKVPDLQKVNSVYFSKFLAAVSVGLFDAALNYLWDETIAEIRKRVIQYDLQYFYDNAVSTNEDKRKKLKNADDIVNLDDSELIQGARNINLISELGYKHLDFIRFMRNWASAAHPNQNQLTGLQLISWLETCIKEVISLPLSNIVIEIQQLLVNIKNNELSESESKKVASFFINLNNQQVNNLALGFVGIYVDPNTSQITSQNIQYLCPSLWNRIDEETRQAFGIKYGRFLANSDTVRAAKMKNFLNIVGGLSYIPEDIKIIDIEIAVQNLLMVHNGMNNFYGEPTFAKQLNNVIGKGIGIPVKIRRTVVLAIVKVFLTNGNGIAYNAEPYYIDMVKQFDQQESLIALLSFDNEQIASSLQFSLCQKKYKELLELIRGKLTAPAIEELFKKIETFGGKLDMIRIDSKIKQMKENVQIILNT